jgi:opacity protein-like surface antigen
VWVSKPAPEWRDVPGQNSNVPITLLGSSDFSAQLAAALGLPFAFSAHFAGGGALVFDPTGNAGGNFAGATTETRGAFVYGAGADYAFTRHISLRAEYRGYVYKAPDFNLAGLNTDSWTHIAQPSAGIVFRF